METRLIAISRILQVLTNQMTKRLILACTHIKEIGRRRNSRNRQADQRGLSDSTVFCFVHYLFCTSFSCSVSFLSLSPGELHMKYSQKFAFYFHFLFFYMEESKPTSAGQRQLFGRICGGHPVPLPEPICLFQPGQDANNGAVFFKKYGPKLF